MEYTKDVVAFKISDSDQYLAANATIITTARVSSRRERESLLVSLRHS